MNTTVTMSVLQRAVATDVARSANCDAVGARNSRFQRTRTRSRRFIYSFPSSCVYPDVSDSLQAMEPNISHRNWSDKNREQLPSQKSYTTSLADKHTDANFWREGTIRWIKHCRPQHSSHVADFAVTFFEAAQSQFSVHKRLCASSYLGTRSLQANTSTGCSLRYVTFVFHLN